MAEKSRRILVTSALPYANNSIHIGHLVEYIQTDIWVRFQRLIGNDCTYVCASDAHGTPVMLRARELGVEPEALVDRFRTEHQRDFAGFGVVFDNYHSTHSPENEALVTDIYARLHDKDLITQRTISQAYDAQAGMFLPDRFVRGTCPRCKAEDQYGDSSEVCGSTYSPSELIDAKSAISGTTPVERESEHYFFRLGAFEESLRAYTQSGVVDTGVAKKLNEWFEAGLQDWDISRDSPYFGFRIPGPKTSSSMSGWMHPSATWQACRISRREPADRAWRTSSPRTRRPRCITSSAKTSPISIRCSGLPYWKASASAGPRAYSCMVF